MHMKKKILKEKRLKIINTEWFHLFLKVHKSCKFKSIVFTAYLGDKIILKSTKMIFIKVRIMVPSGDVEMVVIKENARGGSPRTLRVFSFLFEVFILS